MSELERIRDQLHRAYYGEAWHGPAVRELLEEVDAELAGTRPAEGLHTIWELVLHIEFWESVILKRLQGDDSPFVEADGWRFTIPDPSEVAWQATLDRSKTTHDALEEAVAGMTEDQLADKTPGDYSKYVLLHGVVQHDLYHTGQMAVLKKTILAAGS